MPSSRCLQIWLPHAVYEDHMPADRMVLCKLGCVPAIADRSHGAAQTGYKSFRPPPLPSPPLAGRMLLRKLAQDMGERPRLQLSKGETRGAFVWVSRPHGDAQAAYYLESSPLPPSPRFPKPTTPTPPTPQVPHPPNPPHPEAA
ncbi:unnamed protein product [Closterium sp. NIES-65]|nr:unnamed protein product [Closterium sp. NIES-65]